MKRTDFNPYVFALPSRSYICPLRGIGAMICFKLTVNYGIAAVDHLYPLKPKNPI